MGQTLTEIAKKLRDTDKKVQLIYAFNGAGKTRLSRKFKELIDLKTEERDEDHRPKVLYYNAFTEDLFIWKNDLENSIEHKLEIQPNKFINWILRDRGQDRNIVTNFQRYADDKLTPNFQSKITQRDVDNRRVNVTTYPAVLFSLDRGSERIDDIKISKGEESNFIWSIFYTLLQEAVSILQEADVSKREDDQFDQLKYVFIDDPVSSLDDNHMIELAMNLAGLIKTSPFQHGCKLKYIITTHSPLFYNVICKELSSAACYFFQQLKDGTFDLALKESATNKSISYHHHLRRTLEEAIAANDIEKYHFNLLRNLYEKTADFLGYNNWKALLKNAPDDRAEYFIKVTNHYSHHDLPHEEVAEPTEQQKEDIKILLNNLIHNYSYWQEEAPND